MKLLVLMMCCLSCGLGMNSPGLAQTYPSKAIRFIVPYPAGGAVDILARAVAQKLSQAWGQPVVVDNRVGAGGIIGTELIAKAPPDGYTLGLAHAGPLAVNPSLYKTLPYVPTTGFSQITLMGRQENMVVVHPSLPVRSIKELIALSRAKPAQVVLGSGGSGTGSHLAGELFMSMTGTKMLHVPYKGNAPSVIAILSGEVQVMFPTILTVKPHIEAGRLRALAVTTEKRVGAMPDLPTVAEAGVPGYESSIWFGAMGPAGIPADIVTRLNSEIARILNAPDFKASFTSQGLDIETGSAEQLTQLVRIEQEKWARVIKAAGITAQ
jgi:tripartite-type tricarboxylate transporter receptor subunit TctC